MTAVMTADMDNTDKIVTLVDECQRIKLTMIPPNVNTGRYRFSVNEDDHIVYSIGAIKKIKKGPIEAILEAASMKQKGACRKLVVAGCMVERYREQLLADMPEIDAGFVQDGQCGQTIGIIAARSDHRDSSTRPCALRAPGWPLCRRDSSRTPKLPASRPVAAIARPSPPDPD